nr:MAG TPA: hypothetical protein [Caudoviricetes sp.]
MRSSQPDTYMFPGVCVNTLKDQLPLYIISPIFY